MRVENELAGDARCELAKDLEHEPPGATCLRDIELVPVAIAGIAGGDFSVEILFSLNLHGFSFSTQCPGPLHDFDHNVMT